MPWTLFLDMNSGGGRKEPQSHIYIEAPAEEAKVIFFNRFGHNPERVSCTCCGDDYSIYEEPSLEQATAYHRGCAYNDSTNQYDERPCTRYSSPGSYRSVEEYEKEDGVLVIRADEIADSERVGTVPEQGFVWRD